jgi:hypothetical protein
VTEPTATTAPVTGTSGDADYFAIRRRDAYDAEAILDVVEGRSLGVVFPGFLPPEVCTEVASGFWSSPARRRRGVEAPGYFVGAYHYHKPTEQYLRESAEVEAAVQAVVAPAATELARFWHGLGDRVGGDGVTVRRARHGTGEACPWLLRSWHGDGAYALAPHEDRAQCGEPQQADFEIQGVLDHHVVALNICIENEDEGGRLVVWNIRPDRASQERLGLETTGSPYPPEVLEGIGSLALEVRPGDAYVIAGANVHAVESGLSPASRRTTLACLFGRVDDRTIASWT